MKRIFLVAVMLPLYISTSHSEGVKMRKLPTESDHLARIMHAIEMVESMGNPLAVGKDGDRGILQIRPILLLDYNQRTGKDLDTTDLYSPQVSREIFTFYAKRIGVKPENYQKIARTWNGGINGMKKQSTLKYWKKVQKYL